MSKLRYYAASAVETAKAKLPKAVYTEFLRTGRILRDEEDWLAEEKRYLTYEEVAERTGKRLEAAGERTHNRINSAHRAIKLPKILFHRTLEEMPHLGYCHVTASRTSFARYADVKWSFYIANFNAEIGEDDSFFTRVTPRYGRMYFAVALKPDADRRAMVIDRSIRSDGLLFRTSDPQEALKKVLMLGAKNDMLRKIIAGL
ncbi:hypothetical protein NAC44_19615 [Allorhizobium sp. BGMRC 0089]|uniref:DUF6656 family protein n=1 Tax=Allorhizobium sonneratiae TaxID=2934936 RepID=UPI0020343CAA|nr:DUF6656 family protein [Allorhizobium sonneratiae]MCM2294540.1 hypothetical protein [Allorhizobium sonneratiae]